MTLTRWWLAGVMAVTLGINTGWAQTCSRPAGAPPCGASSATSRGNPDVAPTPRVPYYNEVAGVLFPVSAPAPECPRSNPVVWQGLFNAVAHCQVDQTNDPNRCARNVAVFLRLARFHLSIGQYQAAEHFARLACSQNPTSPESRQMLTLATAARAVELMDDQEACEEPAPGCTRDKGCCDQTGACAACKDCKCTTANGCCKTKGCCATKCCTEKCGACKADGCCATKCCTEKCGACKADGGCGTKCCTEKCGACKANGCCGTKCCSEKCGACAIDCSCGKDGGCGKDCCCGMPGATATGCNKGCGLPAVKGCVCPGVPAQVVPVPAAKPVPGRKSSVRLMKGDQAICILSKTFSATCDSLGYVRGDHDRVVLQGHACVTFKMENHPARIVAESILLNLKDGSYEVNPK